MGKRRNRSRRDTGREGGGFVAIPWSVLDSAAYLALSHPAKALLMEVARQFRGNDNGRMLLSARHLAARGWRSADVITRAKRELLEAELIFETVKGWKPNKASWYAITWRDLDPHSGYDAGAGAFERGAYRKRGIPALVANASPIPAPGTADAPIAPSPGVEAPAATPSPGAMRPLFAASPIPAPGNPLDIAICGAPARRGLHGHDLDIDRWIGEGGGATGTAEEACARV